MLVFGGVVVKSHHLRRFWKWYFESSPPIFTLRNPKGILSEKLEISKTTLPETNSSHLKMDGWNTTFLLGPGLFSGAILVSGRVYQSGQVAIIPKPECFGHFGGKTPLLNQAPFGGIPNRRFGRYIICPVMYPPNQPQAPQVTNPIYTLYHVGIYWGPYPLFKALQQGGPKQRPGALHPPWHHPPSFLGLPYAPCVPLARDDTSCDRNWTWTI